MVIHRDRDVDTLAAVFEEIAESATRFDGHAVAVLPLERVRALAQLAAPGTAGQLGEQLPAGSVWVLVIGPTGAGTTAVSWASGGPLSRFDA